MGGPPELHRWLGRLTCFSHLGAQNGSLALQNFTVLIRNKTPNYGRSIVRSVVLCRSADRFQISKLKSPRICEKLLSTRSSGRKRWSELWVVTRGIQPSELRAAISEAFTIDGPAIVDAVVLANEMPNVPHIDLEQVGHFTLAKIKESVLAVTGG
jgi:hypothetical protein